MISKHRQLALILFCFGNVSYAATPKTWCSLVFRRLLPEVRYKDKNLNQLSNEALLKRWRHSKDPTFKKISDAIANCRPGNECDLGFNGSSIHTIGKMYFSEEGIPIVSVQQIRSILAQRQSGKLYRGRSVGIDFTWANYLGAVVDGLLRQSATNPQIKQVVITGKLIINSDVKTLLSGLGFLPGNTVKAIERSQQVKELSQSTRDALRLLGRLNIFQDKWSIAIPVN